MTLVLTLSSSPYLSLLFKDFASGFEDCVLRIRFPFGKARLTSKLLATETTSNSLQTGSMYLSDANHCSLRVCRVVYIWGMSACSVLSQRHFVGKCQLPLKQSSFPLIVSETSETDTKIWLYSFFLILLNVWVELIEENLKRTEKWMSYLFQKQSVLAKNT